MYCEFLAHNDFAHIHQMAFYDYSFKFKIKKYEYKFKKRLKLYNSDKLSQICILLVSIIPLIFILV
jgi:hypothetical protein